MSVITVRNLPPKVAKAIRDKARKERLSLNKAVISLLEGATGFPPETRTIVHHDLDRFFGTWTKEEADTFDQALREQRQIEPRRGSSRSLLDTSAYSAMRRGDERLCSTTTSSVCRRCSCSTSSPAC